MAQLLRCKACGFIIKENKLKEVCPACGAKRVVFDPYNDKVSEKRRKVINAHIHPVSAHFSVGIPLLLLLLSLVSLIFPHLLRNEIFGTIYLLSLILPIFVVLSFLAGILDGKTRFKKLHTPYLRLKIMIGLTYLVLALILMILTVLLNITSESIIIVLILSFGVVACSAILGKIGGSMINSELPGQ